MKQMMRTLMIPLALLISLPAGAMDAFEYQLYEAEVDKPGEYSLETHLNANLSGRTDVDYPGQIATDHLTHVTLEFSRGLTPQWDVGLYLQNTFTPDGRYHYAGVKLRSKLVLPREETGPWQLGLNVELSAVPAAFEQDTYTFELRPIVGYTLERWTLLANPIIDFDLKSGANHSPGLAPAAKLTYDVRGFGGLGVEYYGDFGLVDGFATPARSEQYLFGVYDLTRGEVEVNVGIGGGLTPMSNPLVAKLIVGTDF